MANAESSSRKLGRPIESLRTTMLSTGTLALCTYEVLTPLRNHIEEADYQAWRWVRSSVGRRAILGQSAA